VLRCPIEDVGGEHDVPMLGDALRLIHEGLPEAEAIGEVDYRGKRIKGVRPHEQCVGGAIQCANLKRLFDHGY
jgi:hypothetical protein